MNTDKIYMVTDTTKSVTTRYIAASSEEDAVAKNEALRHAAFFSGKPRNEMPLSLLGDTEESPHEVAVTLVCDRLDGEEAFTAFAKWAH